MKHTHLWATVILMSAVMVSCGDAEQPPVISEPQPVSAASTDSQVQSETEALYDFPQVDYGAYEFRILNAADIYSMRAQIDRE